MEKSESASAERREAWNRLCLDVKSHAAAEEQTFGSRPIPKSWGQVAAPHPVHEHRQRDASEIGGFGQRFPARNLQARRIVEELGADGLED